MHEEGNMLNDEGNMLNEEGSDSNPVGVINSSWSVQMTAS